MTITESARLTREEIRQLQLLLSGGLFTGGKTDVLCTMALRCLDAEAALKRLASTEPFDSVQTDQTVPLELELRIDFARAFLAQQHKPD